MSRCNCPPRCDFCELGPCDCICPPVKEKAQQPDLAAIREVISELPRYRLGRQKLADKLTRAIRGAK